MTSIDEALVYVEQDWLVFPCFECGPKRKTPATKNGFKDASRDERLIREWWRRRPDALIGTPTGIKYTVLDVDVKDPAAYGFDTLDELGFAILPDVPMAHTESGGLHLYFKTPDPPIRNTAGRRGRGIGPGLDWRGIGGYVILPSCGSGYWWDPHSNFETARPGTIPAALMPREPQPPANNARPVRPSSGLSPYGEKALDSACRSIASAPNGEQECTLHRECFSIGTLVAAGGLPASFAIRCLMYAARNMRDYDSRRPWNHTELARKVNRSFAGGLAHPREIE